MKELIDVTDEKVTVSKQLQDESHTHDDSAHVSRDIYVDKCAPLRSIFPKVEWHTIATNRVHTMGWIPFVRLVTCT